MVSVEVAGVWLLGLVSNWVAGQVKSEVDKGIWPKLKSTLIEDAHQRALVRCGQLALSRAVASVTGAAQGDAVHTRVSEVFGQQFALAEVASTGRASPTTNGTLLEELLSSLRAQLHTLTELHVVEVDGEAVETSSLQALCDELGIEMHLEEFSTAFALAFVATLNRERSLGGVLRDLASQLNDDVTHLQNEKLLVHTLETRRVVLEAISELNSGLTQIRRLLAPTAPLQSPGREFILDIEDEPLQQRLALSRKRRVRASLESTRVSWIELPGISVRQPFLPGATQQTVAEFLKMIVRTVCLGLEELTPDDMGPLEFTGLLSVQEPQDGTLEWHLWLPLEELIGWIQRRVPPVTTNEEWFELVARPLDIRFTWAVPPGILTPLTFRYSPSGALMSVENRTVFENPGAFLNPYICTSTSGFLKFLGALDVQARTVSPFVQLSFDATVVDELSRAEVETDVLEEWNRWFAHSNDEHVLFDSKRVLVNATNPEVYRYNYR